MEMTGIILHVLPDIPLSQPIAPAWSPGGTWITVNPSFVEVQTDEGITGYGPPLGEGLLPTAIALGADAVYIATAALIALGCTVCQQCPSGKCAWGIATTDPILSKRVNPDIGARRLVNLLRGWSLEIKEMLGGMGINALESLRGNRLHLRGIDLTDGELDVLGVGLAGR